MFVVALLCLLPAGHQSANWSYLVGIQNVAMSRLAIEVFFNLIKQQLPWTRGATQHVLNGTLVVQFAACNGARAIKVLPSSPWTAHLYVARLLTQTYRRLISLSLPTLASQSPCSKACILQCHLHTCIACCKPLLRSHSVLQWLFNKRRRLCL